MSTKKEILFNNEEEQDIFVHLEVGDFFVKTTHKEKTEDIYIKIWVNGQYLANHIVSGVCVDFDDDEGVKKIQNVEITYNF